MSSSDALCAETEEGMADTEQNNPNNSVKKSNPWKKELRRIPENMASDLQKKCNNIQ
ncbi:MAG: hypothetical protein OEW26_06740 [Nitrospirota bacterium]|nr:hypothetical protein [Nitrospirota bacterium]